MKNLYRLVLLLTLLGTVSAQAVSSKIHLDDIALGATRFKPTGGLGAWESSVTINAAWTPVIDMDRVLFRGEVGVAWPTDPGGYRFFSMNYQAFAMVPLYSLLLAEAGVGMQYWKYQGGVTNPIATFNFVLRVGEWIDRVYFGYSRYFLAGRPVNQFSSGIAVNVFE